MSAWYGMDEETNNLNSRNKDVKEYNDNNALFNQNLMNQYQGEKDKEGVVDASNYAVDVVNNLTTAGGFKGAWDNRKYEINKAKRLATTDTETRIKSGLGGEAPASKTIAGEHFIEQPNRPGVFKKSAMQEPEEALEGGDLDTLFKEPEELPAPKTAVAPGVIKAGEPTPVGSSLPGGAPEEEAMGEGHGIVAHAINKMSRGAVGLDTAKTIGKVGGAVVGAGIGGVTAAGDIENMIKNHGDPFKKGASWESDANNVGQVVSGISDVVGVVPGLEWVAGLGNVIGGIGSVIGLFGDHRKNEIHDAHVEDMKKGVKATVQAPEEIGKVAIAPTQSTLQAQLTPTSVSSF